jgi:hypothetical protein
MVRFMPPAALSLCARVRSAQRGLNEHKSRSGLRKEVKKKSVPARVRIPVGKLLARANWGRFWIQFESKFRIQPTLSSNLTMQTDQCKNLQNMFDIKMCKRPAFSEPPAGWDGSGELGLPVDRHYTGWASTAYQKVWYFSVQLLDRIIFARFVI